MNDALFAAQQAVFAALAASSDVQNYLGASPRLYDHVPPAPAFPYAVYETVHVAPYDSKTDSGLEQTFGLTLWSRYRGGKETREIFQAIYNALHRATLTVPGQVFLSCVFHSADFGVDNDGLTYHAVARFTLVTQST